MRTSIMRLLGHALIGAFLLLGKPAAAQVIGGDGGAPSGPAGGVLSGSYPSPNFATNPTFTGTLKVPTISTASGSLTLSASNGNVTIAGATAPTIASGACGIGSNGTIQAQSNDNKGEIDIGAVATTACTVTFASSFASVPVCVFSAGNAAATAAVRPYISAISVSALTITSAALASQNWHYICL